MEALQALEKWDFNKIPKLFVKSRPKPIWPRTGVIIHRQHRQSKLLHSERLGKRGSLKGVKGSRGHQGGEV
jgi:hypothetical protein